MSLIKVIFFTLSLSFSFYCLAQKQDQSLYSNIKIDTIPNFSAFSHLTAYEIRLDSMTQASNRRSLQTMLDRKALAKGVSKGIVDSAIQEQKILNTIRYRENRSRYKFQNFKNGTLLEKTKNESDLDSIGTACGCELYGDTIKIGMGIWIFRGFAFSIELVDNKFRGSYWLDEHKRKMFKINNSDTLDDNIIIPFAEQSLILDSLPKYKLGQQLNGYLRFKTINYLRASDFEDWSIKDEYSDKNMDIMYTKGVIHFSCKVRQKLQRDQ